MIRGKTDPTGYQHPEEMPVGKDGNIAVNRLKLCYNPLRPLRYLLDCFSVGTRVCPHTPTRYTFPNLRRCEAFIIAVVPFHQVVICFHSRFEPGMFCGFHRPLQRTAQDASKLYFIENRQKKSSLLASYIGQWNIIAAGMSAVLCPFGLAMTNQVDGGVHG